MFTCPKLRVRCNICSNAAYRRSYSIFTANLWIEILGYPMLNKYFLPYFRNISALKNNKKHWYFTFTDNCPKKAAIPQSPQFDVRTRISCRWSAFVSNAAQRTTEMTVYSFILFSRTLNQKIIVELLLT